MPRYLRFVKGVIDSADLPLNVSRELLQESRDVRAIRDGQHAPRAGPAGRPGQGARSAAAAPAADDAEVTDVQERRRQGRRQVRQFWREFGAVLKEGLGEDFANRERIAKLLRFASTTSDSASVSLADYKARMKEGQEAIYYITADTLAAAKNSPQLECSRRRASRCC
jgi:molecular chaperone HtpG